MLMMRIPAAVVAASVCVGFTCSAGPAFAQSAAQRFHAYDGAAHLDASRLAVLHPDQNVKVVVVMSEDSIATARAKSATHRISDPERTSIEQRVSAQHESVRPAIEGHGGTAVAKFHSALHGIKVDIHPTQIAALAALPGVGQALPVGTYHVSNVVSVPFIGAAAV